MLHCLGCALAEMTSKGHASSVNGLFKLPFYSPLVLYLLHHMYDKLHDMMLNLSSCLISKCTMSPVMLSMLARIVHVIAP